MLQARALTLLDTIVLRWLARHCRETFADQATIENLIGNYVYQQVADACSEYPCQGTLETAAFLESALHVSNGKRMWPVSLVEDQHAVPLSAAQTIAWIQTQAHPPEQQQTINQAAARMITADWI